ncbi:ABC transporter substrate-binding protein [Sinosporangium siamense]|uniref:ABC transporter substrate-binding protein n=1 Tax=Sinosporangium siamense TaxID=1367973 RepID=A0A919V9K9_9ACTN|nr:ABC transporter substrate-binding protein [Sinosporangium siamense]GII95416.1 ABC transporter substrate-binding protein [Sinosporangium siamense]
MAVRSPAAKAACALIALGIAATACASGDRRPAAGPDAKPAAASNADIEKFVVGMSGAPSMLDIAHGFDGASTGIQSEILNTMLKVGSDGQLVPEIAESWSQPEPTTYVFKLRSDVKFWDGSAMTAEDAAYSLARHMDPKVASQAASYMTNIKEVKATGDHEVTVTLKKPNNSFGYIVCPIWQVVKKSFAEKHKRDLGSPTVLTMGTGPFKVEKFNPASGTVLVRNENYWGPKPKIKRLEYKTIPDSETIRIAVDSGELDATYAVDVHNARRWTSLRNANILFSRGNSSRYWSFDVNVEPFSDVHVRRAIAYATNREALAGERLKPAVSPVPEPMLKAVFGEEGFRQLVNEIPQYGFDLAKAKEELAKSKFPNGFEVTVPYSNAQSIWSKILQNTAQNLKQIGITLTAKQVPHEKWVAQLFAHKELDMLIMGASYASPDPGEWLPDVLGKATAVPNAFNLSNYSSPALEENLVKLAASEGEERKKIVKELVLEIADQLPYAPLFYDDNAIALNKKYVWDGEFNTWTFSDLSVFVKAVA